MARLYPLGEEGVVLEEVGGRQRERANKRSTSKLGKLTVKGKLMITSFIEEVVAMMHH